MNKVYRHKSMQPDEYLGRVDEEGKVYEGRVGLDKYVGRVDLRTGKIYESRLGPDKHIGRVEAGNGKVYYSRIGPDEYLAQVTKDGKFYLHRSLARDRYLGKIKDMVSLQHGGGALLLLVVPAYEAMTETERLTLEEQVDQAVEDDMGTETGATPA